MGKKTLTGKIVALRAENITPKMVIESLAEDADLFEEIYVVVALKEGGTCAYMSGSLGGLGFAHLKFQELGIKYLNGELDE